MTAAVFFGGDVANPDTYPKFWADMQMYTTTMTQPDPQVFMDQFTSWEIVAEGQQVGQAATSSRWTQRRSTTRPSRRPQVELDPVKRAALFIRMNDLVVGDDHIIPLVARPRSRGTSNKLAPRCRPGTTTTWALARYWYREAPERRGGLQPARLAAACRELRCNYILRRLLIALPSLLGISVVLFTRAGAGAGRPVRGTGDQPQRAARGAHGAARPVRPGRPDLAALLPLAAGDAAGRLGLLLRQPHRCRRS